MCSRSSRSGGRGLDALAGATLVVVAPLLADPGNAGTLIRSAAAAGAEIIVLGPGSVDAYNPKTVRASAGACFAVRIVEGVPAVTALEALGSAGVQRVGRARHRAGAAPEAVDLTVPVAIVLGHEVHGLAGDLPLDAGVTDPDAGHGVAQRRDGRHAAAVRGRAPTPGRA